MQAKSLFLAAALIALPAASAFAQSAADQSAPTQSSSAAPAPDDASQPSSAQSSPGQSSAAQQSPDAAAATPGPVTLADLKPNAVVYDASGAKVGTIESVTSGGAVVSTGTARAQLPPASFAKNAQGLVIGMTKVQLEAAVAKATVPKS